MQTCLAKKAETIVASYGREIGGVKSINTTDETVVDKFPNCFKLNDGFFEDEIDSMSNVLSVPTTIEKEQVEVVWLF